MKHIAIAMAATLLVGNAYAINKCTGADGKPVFQDAPCSGAGETLVVRPASGAANAPAQKPSGGTGESPRLSEVQRIEAQTAASQKERRLRDLRTLEIPTATAAVAQNKATCEREMKAIEQDKYAYAQNLYGKTHAAQRAAEASSLAAKCNTKDRDLRDRVDALKNECVKLGEACG